MRISRIQLNHFRQFSDLTITDIADTVRLVMLAGPNGCGKSSLFDAMYHWHQANSGHGWNNDQSYYAKGTDLTLALNQRVTIEVFGPKNPSDRDSFYFRSRPIATTSSS